MTPPQLAEAVAQAVAAGATDVHLHPKDAEGRDSLEPVHVDAALAAVRAAAPGVPIGITTGAWAAPDPQRRIECVQSWTVLPDHASVNFHEDGAEQVAQALLARGIGVEAGIFSGTHAADRFLAWSEGHRVLRILAEITETDRDAAVHAADALLADLMTAPRTKSRKILLHGEDGSAWTILSMAATRGLALRIGLEDTLLLPDGTPAMSNAQLVHAARAILDSAGQRT